MKICRDCEFVDAQKEMNRATGQVFTMFFCKHQECVDPVSGEQMPCGAVRKEPLFCGITAKYYKKKEEEKPKQEGNIIQL